MHITSLPGPYGIGDLGPQAYRWIDTLAEAGQTWWQTLPLGKPAAGDSPYQCDCAFAGNPLLISPELLVEEGLLEKGELGSKPLPGERVNFATVRQIREAWLHLAFHRCCAGHRRLQAALEQFTQEQADWLRDYALFCAIREALGGRCWLEWPAELRTRKPAALREAARELQSSVKRVELKQFLFFRQLTTLRAYAAEKGVRLLGDLPIFVAMDSSDVWANQRLFQLQRNGRPKVVAGVPPDAFSATGQLWGNPLYDWRAMERDGYRWWIRRLAMMQQQFDAVRIDHFRGLAAYWAVPGGAKDARGGTWVKGPGQKLFDAAEQELGPLPLVAEDLGIITPDVDELRKTLRMPGMAVLQFAFDSGPANRYLPHNQERDLICYPGTHDNNTCQGWFESLKASARRQVARYVPDVAKNPAWGLIETAWGSVACCAIAQMQDVLELGAQSRMNVPAKAEGNWGWRYVPRPADRERWARLKELTERFGRFCRSVG